MGGVRIILHTITKYVRIIETELTYLETIITTYKYVTTTTIKKIREEIVKIRKIDKEIKQEIAKLEETKKVIENKRTVVSDCRNLNKIGNKIIKVTKRSTTISGSTKRTIVTTVNKIRRQTQ